VPAVVLADDPQPAAEPPSGAAAGTPEPPPDPGPSQGLDDPAGPAEPVSEGTDPDLTAGTDKADKPYSRQNFFKRVFSDQKFLFTDWIGQEIHRPGVVMPFVAGVALAAGSQSTEWDHLDLELETHFHSSVERDNTATAVTFTRLGNGAPAALFLGTAYLIGRFGGHDQLAEASSLSAEALLDTGLWTTIIKKATARNRPSSGADGGFFHYSVPAGQSNASFPSGHASGAFSLATVFAGIYGPEHRWVPWVAYGAAGMVGASRIALGRHFTSDVIVGAVIGNSFGRMVLSRRDEGAKKSVRSMVSPTFDPETGETGAQLTLLW